MEESPITGEGITFVQGVDMKDDEGESSCDCVPVLWRMRLGGMAWMAGDECAVERDEDCERGKPNGWAEAGCWASNEEGSWFGELRRRWVAGSASSSLLTKVLVG